MSVRRSPIGCVPIVWNNADLLDLAPEIAADAVLDEIARIGYAGTQFGRGFAEGAELRAALAERGLRLAELYTALDAGPNGPAEGALEAAQRDLARLAAAGGEVLVVAVHGGGDRDAWSGRVNRGAPCWQPAAFDRLAEVMRRLANAAPEGVRVAFHPHAGTWVEAPNEVEQLASRLPGTGAGLCLDVGHYLVGGGDPVEGIERHGELISHVHVKDVDPGVLARLRSDELGGFGAAIRARIFTEAGNGMLDLDGVLAALDRIGYAGWLMVEQDSSWLSPPEAALVGSRVLRFALRRLAA